MKIIPVDELIKDWTDEEREHLAPLIEECRLREAAIRANSMDHTLKLASIKDNLDRAKETMKMIQGVLDDRIGMLADAIYQITKRRDTPDGNA
jgi:hypothetical protein